MNNKDLRMSIVMMIIFIILFALSFTFKSSDVVKTHTTASFFPQVVLIVAMFLNAIMMYQSVKNGPDKAKEEGDRDAFWRVVLSMAAAIAFGFGVSYLGTLVSISLFIVAVMLIWGVRKKVTIALTALITPVVIYLIFTKILLVQLPSGILI
ncbi:MAG: tripartite tricarboxylate transporter TctB family protein [Desulfofustis sp.]|nr:tripartite tricarboxylate transporter TctB family protein [Desulfofustis sp.]NNK13915.1 tripartite tricarboxylate transporter TctB family protein [Desulfofustis sp.]